MGVRQPMAFRGSRTCVNFCAPWCCGTARSRLPTALSILRNFLATRSTTSTSRTNHVAIACANGPRTLLVTADKRNENFFSEPLVENAAHGAREQKGDHDTRRARARSRFYAPTCDFDKHKLAQRDFLSGSENLACESW